MAERNERRGRRQERDETPEFADRLVAINRVSKTVKGGKRFGFAHHFGFWHNLVDHTEFIGPL